jgi:hypothetical protein
MKMTLLFLWAVLVSAHAAPDSAQYFYASPNGSTTNDGTAQRPWDLASALQDNTKLTSRNSVVKGGATILLRAGTYRGQFTSYLTGNSGAPIVVRPYAGERVILEGTNNDVPVLNVNGAWADFRGLEIFNSNPNRTVYRAEGANVMGQNIRIINCVIHDTGNGIGTWVAATNSSVYGCLIFNCGYQGPDPDRGHGHGIYAQNDTGTKLLQDNIICGQFGFGLHIYSAASSITGFDIIGNTIFNNGANIRQPQGNECLIGGMTPFDRITFHNNMVYGISGPDIASFAWFGYQLGLNTNKSLDMQNNYMAQPKTVIYHASNLTLLNNTFIPVEYGFAVYKVTNSPYVWDRNTFYDPLGGVMWGDGSCKWEQKQTDYGYDLNGTLVLSAPTITKTFVRTNVYERGRANIIVYNWGRQETVEVGLANVLPLGTGYEVRNAQNFLAPPVYVGTYDGQPLRLPMNGLAAAVPVGMANPRPTSPQFNTFILLPRSGSALGPPRDLRVQ